MPNSPLAQLHGHGQCFWLDSLSRQMLDDGSLERRIREQGLSGITSNPAIFAKAMLGEAGSGGAGLGARVYDPRIRIAQETTAPGDAAVSPEAIYERLAVDDVRDACDLLLPRYEQSMTDGLGVDGCVSLEVSPHLAHDAAATVQEARRLWDAVGRPNLLIKVPGSRMRACGRCWPASAGSTSRARAPSRSGCSGPAPAPRTRTCRTCTTSSH